MSRFIDVRIPLIFSEAGQAGPGDALLLEAEGADEGTIARFTAPESPGHQAGCACCNARNAAGQALSRLFLGRARGDLHFYRRVVAVVVTSAGRQAVMDALGTDPLASGCYRLDSAIAQPPAAELDHPRRRNPAAAA